MLLISSFFACPTGLLAAPLARLSMREVIRLQTADVSHLGFDGAAFIGDAATGLSTRQVGRWKDGALEPLADGAAPAASPDGRWLIFAQGRRWILKDRQNGAVRTIDIGSELSGYGDAPVWAPDSRYVAIHYDDRSGPTFRQDVAQTVRGVHVVIRDPALSKSVSPLTTNARLLILDVLSGDVTTRRISETASYAGSWSRSRRDPVYYYVVSQHAVGGLIPFTSVKALHIKTNREQELYRLPSFQQSVRVKLSADGRRLAFVADPDTPIYAVSGSVLLLDLKALRVSRLTGAGVSATALAWGADDQIYFLARNGGLQQLWRIGEDGRPVQLTHDDATRKSLIASTDGKRLAYVVTDGQGRVDVRVWAIGRRRETKVLTIADPGRVYALGRFEPTSWTTPDGLSLKGLLFFPPDFDPGRRYPMLVDVHGGGPGTPLGFIGLFGWRAQTPLEWHAWAAEGYVVFLPDYRSSGEYGAEVNLTRSTAQDGDASGILQDARDVESGVLAMLRRPYIDAHRVAVIGHSAGGPRVDYLLTRTKLFAAAVLDDPLAFGPDAEVLGLAKSGAAASFTRAALPPSEQESLGADFLFDGWRVTTPTLIVVGEPSLGALDPISAETQYAMLLATKTPVRFIHFLDDGHVPMTTASADERYREMDHWLTRYAPSGAEAQIGSQ